MKTPPIRISICIATFRRADRLGLLLDDLARQRRMPEEVVVVDNDATGSARDIVQLRTASAPFVLRYDIQPRQNISLTRNLTVALATCDWLAFIDDDERAPPGWLQQLAEAVIRDGADGVLGPVVPILPATASDWIRRGHFYDWARLPSGSEIPRNRLRFGNLILRGSLLRALPQAFDPVFGLTGGEDGDLLSRLAADGARLTWCDEAIVEEPVETSRLSLRWLMRRALRGGQDFARHALNGRYGLASRKQRFLLVSRSLAQLLGAMLLVPLALPFGRHRAAYWLIKAAANFGKLSLFWGWHYREYEQAAVS